MVDHTQVLRGMVTAGVMVTWLYKIAHKTTRIHPKFGILWDDMNYIYSKYNMFLIFNGCYIFLYLQLRSVWNDYTPGYSPYGPGMWGTGYLNFQPVFLYI